MTTTPNETETADPVWSFLTPNLPPCSMFRKVDGLLRDGASVLYTEDAQGYYVVVDSESTNEILRDPARFSSKAVMAIDPEPAYGLTPIMTDPPIHTKWRQLLASHFSPGRVKQFAPRIRAQAADLANAVAGEGRCDFMQAFASQLPVVAFLELLGLPPEDLPQIREWEQLIDHPDPVNDPDRAKFTQAMAEVGAYFARHIEERRQALTDEVQDLISESLKWRIDGEAIPLDQLLSFCTMIFVAGMDTTASQLGYIFYHLGTHDGDRRRIVAEPDIRTNALEEMLRAYPVIQLGRKSTMDTEVGGCPIRADTMITLPLAGANRDPHEYDRPEQVDFDRESLRHIGFGVGPHRCLGLHLARLTMIIAIEEWHKVIPEYRVPGSSDVVELTGGIAGIHQLPLEWTIP